MHRKVEAFVEKDHLNGRFLFMIYGIEDSRRVREYVPDLQNYLDIHAPKGFISKLEILQGEGHVPDSSLTKGLQFIFSH